MKNQDKVALEGSPTNVHFNLAVDPGRTIMLLLDGGETFCPVQKKIFPYLFKSLNNHMLIIKLRLGRLLFSRQRQKLFLLGSSQNMTLFEGWGKV